MSPDPLDAFGQPPQPVTLREKILIAAAFALSALIAVALLVLIVQAVLGALQ